MGKHFEYHAWKVGLYGVVYCKTVAQITSMIISFGFLYYVTVLSPNSLFTTSKQPAPLNDG